jgi:hypothetical protein
MLDETAMTLRTCKHSGRGVAAIAAAALFALAVAAGPAVAGSNAPPVVEDDHFQVYIGDPSRTAGAPYSVEREWGSVRLTEPASPPVAGGLRSPSFTGSAAGTGVTYFTPSLSGVRLGVGMSALAPEGAADGKAASEYTGLGPRIAPPRDGSGNWQVGGKVGYSGLEIGANIGDHPDPSCEAGVACKKNDFWDIGVALRIGSGAISAGYTASQPRAVRPDDINRIDVFSLNAGYKIHSRLDIYGGVDWVDLHSTNEAAETPVDTRFMFGTNLRF